MIKQRQKRIFLVLFCRATNAPTQDLPFAVLDKQEEEAQSLILDPILAAQLGSFIAGRKYNRASSCWVCCHF
jgi:hypothetical protein